MNVSDFWAEVRQVEAGLSADEVQDGALGRTYYITSLANSDVGTTAGSVSEVTRKMAAEATVKKTHRLSTETEIAQYNAWQGEQRQLIADQEYQRKQQFAMPRELVGMFQQAMTMAQQPRQNNKEKP